MQQHCLLCYEMVCGCKDMRNRRAKCTTWHQGKQIFCFTIRRQNALLGVICTHFFEQSSFIQAVDLELARLSKHENSAEDAKALPGATSPHYKDMSSALFQLRTDILNMWDAE